MNNSKNIIKKTSLILVIIALFLISSYHPKNEPEKFNFGPVEKLGTFVKMTVYADDKQKAQQAVDSALHAIDKAEKIMSCFNPLSELSIATEAAKKEPVAISSELYFILDKALYYNKLSNKTFDPTLPPVIELWKQAGKENKLPDQAKISEILLQNTGCQHIILKPEEVGLPARMSINLESLQLNINAIAEGHIADLATMAMRSMPGVYAGMIDIGGEIVCFNKKPEELNPIQTPASTNTYDSYDINPEMMPDNYNPQDIETIPPYDQNIPDVNFTTVSFNIGIQNPFKANSTEPGQNFNWIIKLENMAVSTSGNYHQFSEINNKRYSHIIDPRTGWPADSNPSVTIIAPTCLQADALATTLSVLTPEEGLVLIESMPKTEAMIISGTKENYIIHRSSGFNKYLAEFTESKH